MAVVTSWYGVEISYMSLSALSFSTQNDNLEMFKSATVTWSIVRIDNLLNNLGN